MDINGTMQPYQQYAQYPDAGQPPPTQVHHAHHGPSAAGNDAPTSASRHPLAPLATVSFWSTVIQRTLQVEGEPTTPLASSVTHHHPLQPQPLPQFQHAIPIAPMTASTLPPQVQQQQQQAPTDFLSLILGIPPPPIVPTSLASRASTPLQQQWPPQPPMMLHPSYHVQQQPASQHPYWPVAAPAGAVAAPTVGSLTHDLGIALVHLAVAAARFGFKATTALTHFIISNPLTRPLAHIWLNALKQLAAFAVSAAKIVVQALVHGTPSGQPLIMAAGGSGNGGTGAAMAGLAMQMATAGMGPAASSPWF